MPNKNEGLAQYTNNVLDYLEYLNYPDMIVFFRKEDVTRAMASTIAELYLGGHVGHRMCAVIIWSMTMNYQVMQHRGVTH